MGKTKTVLSLNQTVSELKSELINNVQSVGYISSTDFRVEDYGNTINVSVRDLGKWKNPSGAEDEEDYEVLLKKFFNITPEECYQENGYDKILVTLSKVLSKNVVKEVKEQIENMLSDNITDIICTIQENSQ